MRHSTIDALLDHGRVRARTPPRSRSSRATPASRRCSAEPSGHRSAVPRTRWSSPAGHAAGECAHLDIQDEVDALVTRGVRYSAARDLLPQRLAHRVLLQMERSGDSPDDRVQDSVARSTPVTACVRIAISGRPQNAEPEKQPETKRQASPDVPTGSATTTEWTYNGSTFSLVADGAERRIFYTLPRAGLTEVGVRSGTLYFEGQQAGRTYRGHAHVFSKVCGAISYPVAGEVSEDNRTISLRGQAPLVDESCRVVILQAVTAELTTLRPLPQTPAPAASGATLMDGAAPTVPTGSFNPRWGGFQ